MASRNNNWWLFFVACLAGMTVGRILLAMLGAGMVIQMVLIGAVSFAVGWVFAEHLDD